MQDGHVLRNGPSGHVKCRVVRTTNHPVRCRAAACASYTCCRCCKTSITSWRRSRVREVAVEWAYQFEVHGSLRRAHNSANDIVHSGRLTNGDSVDVGDEVARQDAAIYSCTPPLCQFLHYNHVCCLFSRSIAPFCTNTHTHTHTHTYTHTHIHKIWSGKVR
jgi:hypothetical protein